MNNGHVWDDGKFIKIFGHGTLSGDKLPHPSEAEPPIPSEDHWTYDPIEIQGKNVFGFYYCFNYQGFNTGAASTSVEGITIANSAHHSLMLVHGYDPDKPTGISFWKVLRKDVLQL